MRLLLLEDDPGLRAAYAAHLRADGYAVDEMASLDEARRALGDVVYDGLVLDRLVTDGDALDLVVELRERRVETPVLLVSGAWAAAEDRVEGLRAGADDYISKPARLDELSLRVRKLTLWRTGSLPHRVIQLGRVRFDQRRHEVAIDGETVHLSPTQYRVFSYLAVRRDRMVPVQELLEHCWDRNQDVFGNAVHSQITRLRAVFRGVLAFELRRGQGYLIIVENPGTDLG